MIAALLIAIASVARQGGAEPCNGVDRSLSADQRASVAPAVERHLKNVLEPQVAAPVRVDSADVLGVFRIAQWEVIHVDSHATDDLYVYNEVRPHSSCGRTPPTKCAALHRQSTGGAGPAPLQTQE